MTFFRTLFVTTIVVVFFPLTSEAFSMNPAAQYFADMIDHMQRQARELDGFTKNPTSSHTRKKTIDAQIIEKKTSVPLDEKQMIKPPPLPQTNDPFTLLNLSPTASFDAVRRAYKDFVKVYHPDVVVGPDASPNERKEANWDFARINAAYDILKQRKNEEVFEYNVFLDGRQVTKTVRMNTEQRQRKKDAHYIDYDRIRQVAEYRKSHPKKKMWYEEDREYRQMNNGFENDMPHYRNEKWWNNLETFEYDQEMDCPQYGYVSTQETLRRNRFWVDSQSAQVEGRWWHNRQTFTTNNNERRWWHEGSNSIPSYDNGWYSNAVENEFRVENDYDVEYQPAQYDPYDTWYKHIYDDTEPKFNGNFGP